MPNYYLIIKICNLYYLSRVHITLKYNIAEFCPLCQLWPILNAVYMVSQVFFSDFLISIDLSFVQILLRSSYLKKYKFLHFICTIFCTFHLRTLDYGTLMKMRLIMFYSHKQCNNFHYLSSDYFHQIKFPNCFLNYKKIMNFSVMCI